MRIKEHAAVRRRFALLTGSLSLDVPQKTGELRFAGKAFPGPRNFGIPYQRRWKVAASLVAFAAGLKGSDIGREALVP